MKILFHLHTKNSYDSLNSPMKIVEFACEKGIDIISITDHNTLKGSKEAYRYAKKFNKKVNIVIGAEYSSDRGDIIGLFLKEEIKSKNWENIIDEIHEQGGIAILPHPYVSHKLSDQFVQKVDIVEVFNSRCDEEQNAKALELSKKFNKPIIGGNDAHLFTELKLGYCESETNDIRKAFFNISKINLNNSKAINFHLSQLIKSLKKRNFILLFKTIKSIISFYLVQPIRKSIK